jgi:chromate transporter
VTELSITAGTRRHPAHGVSHGRALQVWLRVAALSFGGPAGQIAVMHRIIVDEKKWVGESRFLHALSYCMLLPGPEAQQLATYIGWLMHRWPGAIMAGGLFVLPGVVAIMALSWVYAAFGQLPIVVALFFGLKAAVLAIVLQAVHRVGSRALKTGAMIALAAVAFVAIFSAMCPFHSSCLPQASSGLRVRVLARPRLWSGRDTAPGRQQTLRASLARNCPNMRGRHSGAPCASQRSGSHCGWSR